MTNAEQVDEQRMASGLGQDTLSGINQQDGKVGGRGARDHIAGILLMARRVRDNEFAAFGFEIAISDVDGYALFAFGGQPIDQKRKVKLAATRSDRLRIGGQRRRMVVIDASGVVKQATDQGGLAIVHRAAGQEA